MAPNLLHQLEAASRVIADADALLIGAGAGMGVDSGLPDFRGNEGFWKAYPPFRGRDFASVSNPVWFRNDPEQAWGFFGHRLHLYRDTIPHAGFQRLLAWAKRKPAGFFVYTSNVDGQFQKAGFPEDAIFERHGSIHYLQCVGRCTREIWSAANLQIQVDPNTIRATSELPRCRSCAALARPNVLMFSDWDWIADRSEQQQERYQTWLGEARGKKLVAIEFGAGLAIPTVRLQCEARAQTLIRVNPREAETPEHGISLPMGALEAIEAIERASEPL